MKPKDRKCPVCGRFVSEDEGFYAPIPPTASLDDGAELGVYCDEKCCDRWPVLPEGDHAMKGVTLAFDENVQYWTEPMGTDPNHVEVHAKCRDRQSYVGTVLRLGCGEWEAIAFGIWHSSGLNGIQVKPTKKEAVEYCVARCGEQLVKEAKRCQ